MPSVSSAQHAAMEAAAHGHSTLGIPKSVGEEFISADKGRKDDTSKGDCAGILFRTRGPLYFLLQRKDSGEWAQPGGHLEGDETPEDAAVRECVEEIGGCPDGLRWAIRRNSIPKGKGVFTCFLQDVERPFEPVLNDEHTNWGWFAPDQLPEPMHRKVAETIERVSGNELDIAKRMAEGLLLSPQRCANFWLFDVRITGTGVSYRTKHEEYVYRTPETFLTEEFVQRCNGLPLIFEHPQDRVTLNTEEYRSRSIGNIFLPYIKGDEVWGIAKVFDDDAAQLMLTSHRSTSPAVVFGDAGSTETVKHDGSTVLIEKGDPSQIDHLAICIEGVWDKGGEPTGVNIEGDPAVDETNDMPAWADKAFKDMHARLDSIEAGRKDAETEEERKKAEEAKRAEEEALKAGKKEETEEEKAIREASERKDSEEKERKDAEEKARKDSEEAERKEKEEKERADAQQTVAGLQASIRAMEARLAEATKPRSNADRDELSRVQMRAEGMAMAFGDSTAISPPLYDETPIAYRKRCAAVFQKHSTRAGKSNLKALDNDTFAAIEEMIYADAQDAARQPAALPKGRLIPHVDRSTGHTITTYTGDPGATWAPFKHRGFIGTINKDVGKRTH